MQLAARRDMAKGAEQQKKKFEKKCLYLFSSTPPLNREIIDERASIVTLGA